VQLPFPTGPLAGAISAHIFAIQYSQVSQVSHPDYEIGRVLQSKSATIESRARRVSRSESCRVQRSPERWQAAGLKGAELREQQLPAEPTGLSE
jgi:hypothetical protein